MSDASQAVQEVQAQVHVIAGSPVPFPFPRSSALPFQVLPQLALERSYAVVVVSGGVSLAVGVARDAECYCARVDSLSPDLLSQTIAPVGGGEIHEYL